jgi:hypothetical protein
MGPLKDELSSRFPCLFSDLGFKAGKNEYSYKLLGSSFGVIESDVLRARFVNEWGFISVEVASLAEPERWMDLSALWLCLTREGPTPALDGWAWFLRDHLPEITEALGPSYDAIKVAFDQVQRKQATAVAAQFGPRSAASAARRSARIRIRGFVMGPLGWIAAAVLLIWLAVK